MRGHSTDAFASDFTRRSLHVTAHSVLQCNELLFHDIFTEHALYKIKNTVNTECKNDHIQILQCQQDSLNHTPFQKNKINKKTADSTEEGRCQHSSRASHSTECYNLCSESHHCTFLVVAHARMCCSTPQLLCQHSEQNRVLGFAPQHQEHTLVKTALMFGWVSGVSF